MKHLKEMSLDFVIASPVCCSIGSGNKIKVFMSKDPDEYDKCCQEKKNVLMLLSIQRGKDETESCEERVGQDGKLWESLHTEVR